MEQGAEKTDRFEDGDEREFTGARRIAQDQEII